PLPRPSRWTWITLVSAAEPRPGANWIAPAGSDPETAVAKPNATAPVIESKCFFMLVPLVEAGVAGARPAQCPGSVDRDGIRGSCLRGARSAEGTVAHY